MIFLKSLFELFILVIFLLLIAIINKSAGIIIATIVVLLGLIALLRPLPKLRLASRLKSFSLLLIGLIGLTTFVAPSLHFEDNKSVKISKNKSDKIYTQKSKKYQEKTDKKLLKDVIRIPSDPKATYRFIKQVTRKTGNIEITTQRIGPSGVSYSIRLVQCSPLRFGYIADGNNLDKLKRNEKPNMSRLVNSSISDVISKYACGKAKKL